MIRHVTMRKEFGRSFILWLPSFVLLVIFLVDMMVTLLIWVAFMLFPSFVLLCGLIMVDMWLWEICGLIQEACWSFTMKLTFCLIESWFVGYALSSVEGRVAMEFFDLSDAGQSKKYVLLAWCTCSFYTLLMVLL